MDYEHYRAHYLVEADAREYYAAIAEAGPADPQQTARTRDTDVTMPPSIRGKLFNISAEIKNWFHEPGTPMPPLMEGCTVVDLCCGSGRDTYLAAQLVGQGGHVIGVEPNARRLAIAQKYLDAEMKQFGYETCNVELVNATPEALAFIADGSVDIVISNCTFNLAPDKEAYVDEVLRILKQDGEWYFTDVFTDRRIPEAIAKDTANRALRLGGAMYINDFRRLVQHCGFTDPRYPMNFKTELTVEEQALFPDTAFATLTCRLLKSSWTEDVCENFGERMTYRGNLVDYPDAFLYDYNITFPAGAERAICNNVSALMHTRYAAAFDYEGSRDVHLGDTHGDAIIKPSPSYEGVYDEDDQPIQASCC